MSDLDVLDISGVPIPPEEVREAVDDGFKENSAPAFKLCFLGVGQGGGRIAHQFYKYGYRRVCAVNTAIADITPLELPEPNKLTIGVGGGAGGDPIEGQRVLQEHREDVYNLMRKSFGAAFDRVLIAATAGGGTGAGGVFEAVNIAHDLLDKLELRGKDSADPQVGVIVALPKESDGRKASATSAQILQRLYELVAPKSGKPRISPLIILDNQRIDRLYPKTPAGKFWETANHSVCSIFHLLNTVAARESRYTSFDKKDLEALLKSGLLVFGAMPVRDWKTREGLSNAIRENLTKNLLVGSLSIKSGKTAGCIVVGKREVLDNDLPQAYIDEGLSMLARTIQPSSSVRYGIYAGNAEGVVVYTLIGGLDCPLDRINALRKVGGLQDWDGA